MKAKKSNQKINFRWGMERLPIRVKKGQNQLVSSDDQGTESEFQTERLSRIRELLNQRVIARGEKNTPEYWAGRLESANQAEDVSIRLLTLMETCSHPKHGEEMLRNLAQNTPLYHQLRELVSLWQSLGCPRNIFWQSTIVRYNYIADSFLNGKVRRAKK